MDIKEAIERQKKILRHFNKDEKSHLKRILLSGEYMNCGCWIGDSIQVTNMSNIPTSALDAGGFSILFFKFLKGIGPGAWSEYYQDSHGVVEIIESMSCDLEDVPLHMGGPHESSTIAKYRLEIRK